MSKRPKMTDGADHIRLVKSVVQPTPFPYVIGAADLATDHDHWRGMFSNPTFTQVIHPVLVLRRSRKLRSVAAGVGIVTNKKR